MSRRNPMLVLGLVLLLSGCGKPLPPPAAADDPIPLEGSHKRLDAVQDNKYMHYAVGASIDAPPDVVWAVLTDAAAYPRWNSTIVSIEGEIKEGETIRLVSKVDPKRVFKLRISSFQPARKLVWEDGNNSFKGVRTFTLQPRADGGTDWTMKEAFSGSMMKMIAPKLPDFGPSFDTFAADLKREAERRAREGR